MRIADTAPTTRLGESALSLLRANDTGRYVTPSRKQYIHQWLWDSCFHAIALAHFDLDWARRELASVFESQWDDGMLPHVRFSDDASSGYRPNASDWNTGYASSGVTQPPLPAVAARILHERGPDRDYLRHVVPRMLRYHAWLRHTRDPDGSGLVTVVHPWESGCDNSPIYDQIRDAFLADGRGVAPPARVDRRHVDPQERPGDDDYRFYWGLIALFQGLGWDSAKIEADSPCRVADVTFNSIWARANADLAALARELGLRDDARRCETWADETCRALAQTCWCASEGLFVSQDLTRDAPIRIPTVGGFLPLLTGAPSEPMVRAMVEQLCDRRRFGAPAGVPSTALDASSLEPRRYWRGPVWINMHWLIVDGLRRHGCFDVAADIVDKSVTLVEAAGFREYYDPFTGEGLGAPSFSWSTLAHDMRGPPLPEMFTAPKCVLARCEAKRDPSLAVLYDHPDVRVVTASHVEVTSTPDLVIDRLLAGVPDAVSSVEPTDIEGWTATLRRVIDEERYAGDDYPRLCDAGVQMVARACELLGLSCRTHWSPHLHYFSLVCDATEREWIVDLTADQFAWHPASRIPLLLEVARFGVAKAEATKSLVALEAAMRQGHHRLGELVARTPPRRPAPAERAALREVYGRYCDTVERACAGLDPRVERIEPSWHLRGIGGVLTPWLGANP